MYDVEEEEEKPMFLVDHSLLSAIGTIVELIYKNGNTEEERKKWVDSIGQIYTCSCVSIDAIPELLKRENKEVNGIVDSLMLFTKLPLAQKKKEENPDIDVEKEKRKIMKKHKAKMKESVIAITTDLIGDLLDNDKITQLKSKIPEGQKTIKVESLPSQRENDGLPEFYETSGDEYGEVYTIGGHCFECGSYKMFDRKKLYVDPSEDFIHLIATEFAVTVKTNPKELEMCKACLSALFPGYTRVVEAAYKDALRDGKQYIYWGHRYDDVMVDEEQSNQPHTGDDVGNGMNIDDISLKDIEETMGNMVEDDTLKIEYDEKE